jgi:uncharacterized protein YsxB (DUF464 family)
MTQIQVSAKNGSITKIVIKGHSGFDVHGKDLVCAGISSITFGALNALDEMFPNDCSLSVGSETVTVRVINQSQLLESCLEMLLIQYQTVREQYPQYVKIFRKEV